MNLKNRTAHFFIKARRHEYFSTVSNSTYRYKTFLCSSIKMKTKSGWKKKVLTNITENTVEY